MTAIKVSTMQELLSPQKVLGLSRAFVHVKHVCNSQVNSVLDLIGGLSPYNRSVEHCKNIQAHVEHDGHQVRAKWEVRHASIYNASN
jgi:hypothetical protein